MLRSVRLSIPTETVAPRRCRIVSWDRCRFTPGATVKLVGLLVAAFVAEQKSADHSGKLMRFLPTESGA
jgi:hypothetical protein